jgi:hypothetical protein
MGAYSVFDTRPDFSSVPRPTWYVTSDRSNELHDDLRTALLSPADAIILAREGYHEAPATDDWLEGIAALADDPPFLAALNGAVIVTVQARAEAGIRPPFHVLLAAVVLAAVLDVRAATRRLRR